MERRGQYFHKKIVWGMGGRVVTEGGKRRGGGATNPASKVDAEVGEKGGRSTGGWERRGGFF